MKKMILPVLLAGSLFALSGATTATVAVAEPATAATTPIVADSGAVLTLDTVTVDTVAAPVAVAAPVVPAPEVSAPVAPVAAVVAPVESVAPVVAPEPVTAPVVAPVAPVATAPASGSTADTVPADKSSLKLGDAWAGAGTYYAGTTPTVAPVAPVAPVAAQADTYPAPLPEVTCMEDMPCWDCHTMGNGICGNPACAAQNLFTVANQQCDRTPYGWTVDDSITDAKTTLVANGLDPAHFIYQGSQKAEAPRADGYKFVPAGIKGMVHLYLEIR